MEYFDNDHHKNIRQIVYAISLYWQDLNQNPEDYQDVIENVLTKIIQAKCLNKTCNVHSLVREEKRKYVDRTKREKPLDDDLLDLITEKKSAVLDERNRHNLIMTPENLGYIWEIVPELKLSLKQSRIYSSYLRYFEDNEKTRGFESHDASIHGISQAAISKDLKRAIEKIRLSALLIPDELNVKELMEIFGNDWSTSALRRRLWPLLKPGKKRNLELAKLLKPYQNAFFEHSISTITSFSALPVTNTKLFCQGYNALILGTYIDPDNIGSVALELQKKVASKSWLAGRVVARQAHLIFDKEKCEEYRDWLLRLYFNDESVEEKEKYIGYMVGYFGGYDNDDTSRFILSKANFVPHKYNVDKLIKEHYQNISDPLYTRAPILMEINFMRIALILSTIFKFEFMPSITSCISQIFCKTESVSRNSKVNQVIHELEKKIERR